MTIQVETKDCTALSDAELSEMADICADGPAGYDVGLLSKQRDEWVLNSQARESGKLLGFSFCTLERIGGTPCVLIGLASVKRNGKREQVLKAIVNDQLRRAWLAFPDEDVLVREGEPRPPKLVVDDRLEHLLALAIPLHRRQPDEDAGRAADALEGAEREAEELARLAGLAVQDPLVALLREQPDVVARRPVGADVGHLGQLGVREGGAVLRLDLNRHSPSGAVATSQFQSVRAIRATRRAGRWSSRR